MFLENSEHFYLTLVIPAPASMILAAHILFQWLFFHQSQRFCFPNSLAIITFLEVLTTMHHTIFSFVIFSYFYIFLPHDVVCWLSWFSNIWLKKNYNAHFLTLIFNYKPTSSSQYFPLDVSISVFPQPRIGNVGSIDTHDHCVLFAYFDKIKI